MKKDMWNPYDKQLENLALVFEKNMQLFIYAIISSGL